MAYNPKEALEALNKKYGVTLPKTQTSTPVTQQPKKAAESQLDKLAALNKKYGVSSVEEQMRATGYLTDTPVGNTLKVERTTPSSKELRKRLDNINANIAEYQQKAKDSENEEWLASISHITFNDTAGTAEQARARTETYSNLAKAYAQQRDKIAAELDEAVYGEYMELSKQPDFATKSQYKSTATGESENLKNGYVSSAFTDPVYDYINGNEDAEGFIALQESKTGAKALGFDKTKYSQMTADEVAVYNYLYSQSKEKADEFLKAMEKKLSTRQGAAEAARIDAEPNAVKRGVAKAITAAQSGLDSSIQGLAQSMTDEVLPKSQLSYTGEAVKETTSGVGRFIYDSVELVSHMVPSILTSYAVSGAGGALATTAQGLKKAKTAGQLASSLVTAVSAAGNSYAEQVEKGLTKQQSKTIAALIGASEGGLQYLLSGVGAMGGKLTNNIISNKIAGVGCGLARVGLKLVASGVSEAVEEVLQLYVEPAVIAAVTGDAYDAPTRAEVIYTALLSAVSAGFFEGGEIVRDEASLRAAGRVVLATDSVRAVIDAAAKSDNPSMQRLAEKLDKKLSEGKKISAYDLGRAMAESAHPDGEITEPETPETATPVIEENVTEQPAVPAQQTTPFETKTETIVGEDGTTRVKLPQVVRRDAEAQTAKPVEIADSYPNVPTHSPTGRRYTDLERSGIASGASEENIAMAQRLSNYTKRRILFYDGNAKTGDWARANGAYAADADTIYINSRGTNPVAQIFAHEMTHSVEGTDSYSGLSKMVLDYMANQGNDLDAMRATKRKAYGRSDANFDVDAELVAEFVETKLLTDETEIRKVAASRPSLARAILEKINSFIAKLPFAKGAKERDFLIRARDMYSRALKEAQTRSDKYSEADTERAGTQFLFAGKKALTADLDALSKAADMELNGETSEKIFRTTGWFRGADGKWRFEIDDSPMRYKPSGDALMRQNNTGYAELKELELKFIANYDEWTDADQSRFNYLREIYGNEPRRLRERVNSGDATLEDILEHDGLFAAYPELRDTKIKFADLEDGTRGTYNRRNNTITLNKELKHKPESTLLHEIQHAIQNVEGFSGGSSPEYWAQPGVAARTKANKEVVEAAKKKLDGVAERLDSTELTLAQKYVKLTDEYFESDDDPELYRQLEEIERLAEAHGWGDLLNEYIAASGELAIEKERQKLSPLLAYRNTAGEIEARDAATRRDLTAEMRRKSLPDTGDENTVFATSSRGYALSKEENDSIKKQLRNHENELNNTEPVAVINDNGWKGMTTGEFRKKIVNDLKKTGYRVDNPSMGVIEFDEKLLNRSLNYIETDAEAAAYQALPRVLKRGIEISGHDNHKGRDYETVTIAAPVILNGKRGNMAVVVMKTKGNRYKVHRVLTPDGKTFELPEMANAESTTVGDITATANAAGVATPTINSASKNNITDKNGAVNTQFSIPAESSEQTEEKAPSFSAFPKKAQNAIKRAERYLITGIGNLLSVPGANSVEEFQTLARKATDAYLENGRVPNDLANELFDTAYEKGRQIDDEFYNTYKHVKDYLRKTPVVLRAEYRSDMGDYNEFRKKAFGVLNLNNAATRGIDQVYLDLIEMAPELFPEDITHPADQLQRMYDVATSIQKVERDLDEVYGPEAEGYKEWARAQFYADLNDYVGELNSAKRYADAEATKRTKPEQTLTVEDVKALHKQLKPLKRELEKATAKNLLTDADRLQVGRLLRGDILLKHLDPEKDNVKGITEVYEAALKCEEIASQINEYKQNVKAARRAAAQELVGDTQQWEDRLTGIMYDRETPERNLRKIVKDPERAETLIKAYIAPVHEHEADATRFKKSYRDRVRNFKLSRKINKGDVVSESYAVQLLGEAEDCIAYLEQAMRHTPVNKRDKLQRGGKSLTDWKAVVENLFIENPGLDEAKIRNAVKEFRAIYDELFEQMNDVRVRNGYDPVSYRRGYFPHFQASDPDGLLATFGKALGITTDIVALPTTINGLTHTFKPGIRWFGNALERVGFETTYDAVQGFDKYIEGVADVIHHTDDIQNLRALASWVRYAASDEGLKEQENAIRADPNRSDEDKELAAQELYKDGKYRLSKFVTWLEEYTNLLANKKSRHDRDLEDALNRNIYNAAKNLESRVAANMVSINIGSWLTNFIPITQASAAIKTKYLLKGMVKTLAAIKNDDGMVGRSDFLTNRRGSDPLVQNWTQKTSAVLSKGMELVDSFTSDTIVRARYYENLSKGMSEEASLADADAFAASVIADRSKGATPTLFQQKNPITKLFTQFQLEVNNQLSYLFKDIPREMKDKGIAALAMALLKFMIGAWLYNEVYEFVIGRRPALDVLNILNETAGDVAGWEIPNLIDIGRAAAKGEKISFESERKGFGGTLGNLGENVLEQLPFTSLLNLAGMDIDAGRVAISSAVPNFGKVVDAFEEGVSGKKRLQTLAKELGKPAAYILPPFGGGQIKKIVEGISAVSRGGSYTVDKEGNDILQYPIYRDTTIQTFQAALGAAIFGKSSLRTGREWVESDFKSLSAKDTALYQALTDLGVGEEKAYNFIKEFKAIEKTDTDSELALQRKFLAESDLSDRAKTVVYYSALASNSEKDTLKPILENDKEMTDTTKKILKFYEVDPENEKALAMVEAGLTAEQYIAIRDEYRRLDGADLTAQGKASQFSNWLDNQKLTAEQKAVIKENLKYYSFVKQEAKRYDSFVKAGISDKVASDLDTAIRELEPIEGKTTVSAIQKWNVAVSKVTDEKQLQGALEALMSDDQYAAYKEVIEKADISSAMYVKGKALLSEYGSSPSNEEITWAIQDMASNKLELPAVGKTKGTLTDKQRAILWQLWTGSTSTKNNPWAKTKEIRDVVQPIADETKTKAEEAKKRREAEAEAQRKAREK